MTELRITDSDIPRLDNKVAVVTGGSSGIGLATAKIFASAGAQVFILDRDAPEDGSTPPGITFVKCDIVSWVDLTAAFEQAGRVDIAVANAGVSEDQPFFEDTFDAAGKLREPSFGVLDVNFKGTVMFIKLAASSMCAQGTGGSIVLTTSATGYAPEQNLPVYGAVKAGLIGLVRSLRSTLPCYDISINAVAPSATTTKLLPQNLAGPLLAAGLPVSSAHVVGLAVAYSATARQERMVESYGKQTTAEVPGKWNGRVIVTLGGTYTEIEEKLCDLKPVWFGWKNTSGTRKVQTTADFRTLEAE